MSAEPVLKLRGIHKRYADTPVLRGVDLELMQGESKIIVGPSGTGKSTLLRCVNYLSPPDQGDVLLEGQNVGQANIDSIRSRIGFVFQDFNLFTHLRVVDNVILAQRTVKKRSKAEARERAEAELERVGLTDRMNAFPAELSGGQKQRAAIARALAMDPVLVLFDEPTSALDPELTGEVVQVMKQLAQDGMTMLVVSHEMGFARAAADEVIFMEGGLIVEQGPSAEVLDNPQKERTAQFLSKIKEGH